MISEAVFLLLLAPFAIAQNSALETLSEKKAEIQKRRFMPFREFNTSSQDRHISTRATRRRTSDSHADSYKTIIRNGRSQTAADSIKHTWVQHYGPALESVSDRALDLAVDKSGNLYVAGSSDGDYVTIKYDASGSQEWIRHYTASERSDDWATSILVDRGGYIYVSGFTADFYGSYGYDYVTIKYDSLGHEQWIAHYDADASFTASFDKIAIAVDSVGDVYIAPTNNNRILKYDASGHERWVKQASKDISVLDMTMDSAGHVYVTGSCIESTSDFIVTAKYDSSGDELWIREYRREMNMDIPSAIAVDDSGNVYVTGFAHEYTNGGAYITIKYDSAGVERWVAHYDGPANSYEYAEALGLDHSGNVYVTGESGDSCATIMYNASGIEQWAARFGRTNFRVGGKKIASDVHGDVYVSGYAFPSGSSNVLDYMTIKYNASGEEQWVNFYSKADSSYDEGKALAVDHQGSVYITGMSYDPDDYYDCVTVKYDGSGNEQWVARYDGPKHAYAGATAVAVDQSGYVYVTGGCVNKGITTFKYSSAGEELWTAAYGDGWAKAMAVDPSGNVYVTGTGTYGGSVTLDYITIKYNTDGVEQWVAHYDGTAHGYDEVTALALDSSGNAYVTGFSYGAYDTVNEDYATVKYSTSGIEQWVARYNGPSRSSDHALAIAVDAHGNSYVTGVSWNSATSRDVATIKYDTFGREKWVARYHGPGNSLDEGRAIGVDAMGNVFVTGSIASTGTGLDYATIKYDASGGELWVAQYDGPANQDDAAGAIKLDDSGNLYVTGYSTGSGTSSDFATVKYNPAGTEQWVARYNGPGNGIDDPAALTVTSTGNIYVTGKSEGVGTLFDIATIKYDSAGNCTWVARFNGTEMPDDHATAIADDASESIYVAGYSGSEEPRMGYRTYIGIGNRDSKYTLIKYSHESVSVGAFDADVPQSFRLEQNYPNPFNPSTTIRYGLPRASHVMLNVYNTLGQHVAQLVNETIDAGNHEVKFDASGLSTGMYFYRLSLAPKTSRDLGPTIGRAGLAGGYVDTKKFLLIR